MRILVVEDEPEVADLLRRTLSEAYQAVDVVAMGNEALTALGRHHYDLVVLDLGLPDVDGVELCRRLRKRGEALPILMLTARAGLGDRVTGLDAGADDYLTKPFAPQELLARLRALSRRPRSTLDVVLRLADLELDLATRVARRAGVALRLTAREQALLECFLRHRGRVLSRGQIVEQIWDDGYEPIANAVDVLVGRLRRRIDLPGARPLIHTVRGLGYMMSEDPPPHG